MNIELQQLVQLNFGDWRSLQCAGAQRKSRFAEQQRTSIIL